MISGIESKRHRSHAPALIVIHKYSQDIIPASARGIRVGRTFYSSHVPAWEFSPQRSSVAGRWSVYHCIPTPERGNDAISGNCSSEKNRTLMAQMVMIEYDFLNDSEDPVIFLRTGGLNANMQIHDTDIT